MPTSNTLKVYLKLMNLIRELNHQNKSFIVYLLIVKSAFGSFSGITFILRNYIDACCVNKVHVWNVLGTGI